MLAVTRLPVYRPCVTAPPSDAGATRTWEGIHVGAAAFAPASPPRPVRRSPMNPATRPQPHPGLRFREFVALIAALMALNALSIDTMLPALPAIGESLGVAGNARQWVVTSYLLGFGVGQIVYGTLADRFGRRPVLLWAIAAYVLFSAIAAISASFALLLGARVLMGLASAASRVLSITIIRDCYVGRTMARVMSLAFIVFLAVPMMAPALGQILLSFASWRWIFGAFAIFGTSVFLWTLLRLPETMHVEDRRPITVADTLEAFRLVVSDRASVGYSMAQTLVIGGLFGFIGSVQQIFTDVFHAPLLFPWVFAGVAGTMAVSSYANSRIVERFGTRRVSHTALFGFILFAALHLLVALTGIETMWTFAVLQALMMGCFGLTTGNFGAMAMEKLGHVAGTASSVQGSLSTVAAALIGMTISQSFNGSTVPLTLGFTVTGLFALLVVLVTERGKLFRPQAQGAQEHFGGH